MNSRFVSVLVALLAVLTMTAGAAGLAAADHAGDADVVVHEEINHDNDTLSVWADVVGAENITTSDNATNVTVVVEGWDSGGATELHNETLNVTEGATVTSEYTLADSDAENYDRLNLTVETVEDGHGEHIDDNATEWGTTIEQVGGGGGGGLTGDGAMGGVAVLVILGGAYILLSDD